MSTVSGVSTQERPMLGPVFFYADDCRLCAPTLAAVAPIFSDIDIQLFIRKPTSSELSIPGFAFPALYLPVNSLKNKQAVLLVGANIQVALLDIIKSTKT